MDNLEFRAWDKKAKKMLEWSDIIQLDDSLQMPVLMDIVNAALWKHPSNSPFEVMHFTGRYDTDKKRIYRLDILKHDNLSYLVTWDYDRLYFYGYGLCGNPDKPLYELCLENDTFVMGNGHENPELIKELNT